MFTDNFLGKCRTDFIDYVAKFTYTYILDEEEIDGELKINSVSVSGNYIVWSLSPKTSPSNSYTIKSVNLYDSDGTCIGTQSTSISVNATQTVLVVFKVLYQEVADSSDDDSEEETE